MAFTILFTGCTKDDDEGQSFNLVNEVQFIVSDAQGNSLIPNKYNADSIKLFSLVNGEAVEAFDSNLDFPRNFRIIEKNGENILVVWPIINEDQDISTTLIEWEEGERDTLKTSYLHSQNATILQKVWYNGELILSAEEDEQYLFELVKE